MINFILGVVLGLVVTYIGLYLFAKYEYRKYIRQINNNYKDYISKEELDVMIDKAKKMIN